MPGKSTRNHVRNRLDADWLDAALNLLDRQVIDVDGLFVCNVDDLAVVEEPDGTMAVRGLLVGPAALWPRMSGRFGGWLRETWQRLGVQYADRSVPFHIGLDVVDQVGSAVELSVARNGLLTLRPDPGRDRRARRVGELLEMEVRDGDGARLGKVLDVRLVPRALKSDPRLELTELIVGRGGPGSLLGYDRGDFNGPWLIQRTVEWLHRHTRRLPLDRVVEIDWDDDHITADGPLLPLKDL
jgi:sporulation protein YlmC with PRC-barrel domain